LPICSAKLAATAQSTVFDLTIAEMICWPRTVAVSGTGALNQTLVAKGMLSIADIDLALRKPRRT